MCLVGEVFFSHYSGHLLCFRETLPRTAHGGGFTGERKAAELKWRAVLCLFYPKVERVFPPERKK